jgi:hypothetical protein
MFGKRFDKGIEFHIGLQNYVKYPRSEIFCDLFGL